MAPSRARMAEAGAFPAPHSGLWSKLAGCGETLWRPDRNKPAVGGFSHKRSAHTTSIGYLIIIGGMTGRTRSQYDYSESSCCQPGMRAAIKCCIQLQVLAATIWEITLRLDMIFLIACLDYTFWLIPGWIFSRISKSSLYTCFCFLTPTSPVTFTLGSVTLQSET